MSGLEWCGQMKGDVVPLGRVVVEALGGVEGMSQCGCECDWLA